MKQIVDKLNKIARAVDSNVTLPRRKLIIDSLDAITTAFKGTIVNSHLIVDKLDAIAWAVGQYDGGGGSGEFLFRSVQIKVNHADSESQNLLGLTVAYPTIQWDENGTWFGTDLYHTQVVGGESTTVTLTDVVIAYGYKYTLLQLMPHSLMQINKVSGNAEIVSMPSSAQSGTMVEYIQIPISVATSGDITIEVTLVPIFQ